MKTGLLILAGMGFGVLLSGRGYAGNTPYQECKEEVEAFAGPDCTVSNCPQKLQAKYGKATFELNEPTRKIGTVVWREKVPSGKTRLVNILVGFVCNQEYGCSLSCKID